MNRALAESIKRLSNVPVDNRKVILMIDFMNLFFRNYLINKTLDPEGYHCGGILGTVTSLKYLVKILRPDKIFICYEGKNSTKKRKEINEGYKAGRIKQKLSPFKEHEYLLEQPEESLQRQIHYVKQILYTLPLIHLEIEELEADDIIAFLCKHFENEDKIIASTDQDFYQLLDINTRCFNPVNKSFVTVDSLINLHSIHPNNFALCKSIKGDDSDNLKGVKGIAFKSIVKMFPFVKEEKKYSIEDIVKYSETKKYETTLTKKYNDVLDNINVIQNNFTIMNLKFELDNSKKLHLINRIENTITAFKFDELFHLFSKFNATKESLRDFSYIFTVYNNI